MNNLCCILDKVYICTACDGTFCQKCFESSDHTWRSGPSVEGFDHINTRWWRCIQSHKYVSPKDINNLSLPIVLTPLDGK